MTLPRKNTPVLRRPGCPKSLMIPDPWLCVPGLPRVCSCRKEARFPGEPSWKFIQLLNIEAFLAFRKYYCVGNIKQEMCR